MRRALTVPEGDLDEIARSLDERKRRERSPAIRSESRRDRDRILYSSAFLRLSHITQVAAPEAGHIFHSRLTHSLKVAQVARSLTERLQRLGADGKLGERSKRLTDLLDADATEAAALGHDLGHPPFGHLAEQELEAKTVDLGSFEGNAQSFRIVTKLSTQSLDLSAPGLNLTRRTLNGLLKYPRVYDPEKDGEGASEEVRAAAGKWGVYESEAEDFKWAHGALADNERSLEAELMDWADDVTYAVHDMDDFYRAGLLPLERLSQLRSADELRSFEDHLRGKFDYEIAARLTDAAEPLFSLFMIESRYRGRAEERAKLRKLGSWLITRYMDTVKLVDADEDGRVWFEIGDRQRAEVDVLKELIWFYVIERPSLATIQRGQRQMIKDLFDTYSVAATSTPPELRLFPPAISERVDAASSKAARIRAVVDYLAGMTEASVREVHLRMSGVSTGSLTADIAGPA